MTSGKIFFYIIDMYQCLPLYYTYLHDSWETSRNFDISIVRKSKFDAFFSWIFPNYVENSYTAPSCILEMLIFWILSGFTIFLSKKSFTRRPSHIEIFMHEVELLQREIGRLPAAAPGSSRSARATALAAMCLACYSSIAGLLVHVC